MGMTLQVWASELKTQPFEWMDETLSETEASEKQQHALPLYLQ